MRTSVSPGAENMKKGTLKCKCGKPPSTSPVTQKRAGAHDAHKLSCNQLCKFLSVAHILDDQAELSFAGTERDLNVSEMAPVR